MKIKKELYYSIIEKMPLEPPEVGGIIGGMNEVVRIWCFDEGCKACGCIYRPNVESLNQIIEKWMDEGYEFMGILHVHFGGAKSLSEGDIRYIEKIMMSMPITVEQLYFPIVVQPEGWMISYKAKVNAERGISIVQEKIEVI